MKKHYELVCVIDPRLSMEEIRAQKKSIESHLTDIKKDVDDMGLLPLAYPLKGQSQAYFLSYYLESEPAVIAPLKGELMLEKGVLKLHIFSLRADEQFLKFAELKKTYEALMPQEPEDADEGEETKEVAEEKKPRKKKTEKDA